MALTLSSTAFKNGGPIPPAYTCDGQNRSPNLVWDGLPEGTKSLALIADDPDAPDPKKPKRVWVHWVLYNLPGTAGHLPGGVHDDQLPEGTLPGKNDWDRTGYGGPCPPIGRHRYFFKLYALDTVLPDLGEPTKAELEAAMKGHVLEHVQIIGTYERPR